MGPENNSARGIREKTFTMNNKPTNRHKKHYTTYRKIVSTSKIVGYFSIDEDRNYLSNSSKLKYFKPPKNNDPINFDLNQGLNEIVKNETSGKKKVRILQWIEENRDKIKPLPGTDRLLEPNFVAGIGSLRFFMCARYSPIISWKILVGKWKGTIYLRPETCAPLEFDNELKFWYWGRKFQQYIVSESPDKAPDTSKPAANGAEFRCVYQHQFSNFSVLFAVANDAVVSNEALSDPLPLNDLKFIKSRTCKVIEHGRQRTTLRKNKFLSWWANAYLTNVNEVVCGFWNDNGMVNELKTYDTDTLVKSSTPFWSPEGCIDFCEELFAKLAEAVVDDCDKTIYEFSKKPYEDFEIKGLEPSEENCVVPQWFKDAMS